MINKTTLKQMIIRRIVFNLTVTPLQIQSDCLLHDWSGLKDYSLKAEFHGFPFNSVHHFIGNMVPAIVPFNPDPLDLCVTVRIGLESRAADGGPVDTGNDHI